MDVTRDDFMKGLQLLAEVRDLLAELVAAGGGRLAEPAANLEISSQLDPDYLPGRSSSTGDPRLSESIAQYLAQKAHEVSPQHLSVTTLTLGSFEGYISDPGYSATTAGVHRDHLTAYRQSLLDNGRTTKTANNHMAILTAFFAWTVEIGQRESNPASGLKLRDRSAASRKRKAFTSEQIGQVFDGLVEHVSPLRMGDTHFTTSAKAWLPLIMLYTGARPEEVAQLRAEDVRQMPAAAILPGDTIGTWVFDFATMDDGQRRKNEASRRLVPVHPRLWELGLEKLIGAPVANYAINHRLFPELQPGANGRLAEAPSRWFNRKWLREVKGIEDRKLVLYSLRHSVATKLKHSGVEESMIAQILGHANASMTTGRYGKEFPVSALNEIICTLDWDV